MEENGWLLKRESVKELILFIYGVSCAHIYRVRPRTLYKYLKEGKVTSSPQMLKKSNTQRSWVTNQTLATRSQYFIKHKTELEPLEAPCNPPWSQGLFSPVTANWQALVGSELKSKFLQMQTENLDVNMGSASGGCHWTRDSKEQAWNFVTISLSHICASEPRRVQVRALPHDTACCHTAWPHLGTRHPNNARTCHRMCFSHAAWMVGRSRNRCTSGSTDRSHVRPSCPKDLACFSYW